MSAVNAPTGENEGWRPYAPVAGSFVELFPDGSFRLDGKDTVFASADAVSEVGPALCANKEPGEGMPLYVVVRQDRAPILIALRFNPEEKCWYRREDIVGGELPNTQKNAPEAPLPPSQQKGRLLNPSVTHRQGEVFFRIAFFLFLGWYLFIYHGVFRGQSFNEEVLPEYPVPEVAVPSPASPDTGERPQGKVLYDGGYSRKPPGWN